MKKNRDKDVNQDNNELEEQNLANFKSPPKKTEIDTTKVGDDTPDATTQGYAEENVIPNPVDKKRKKTIPKSKNTNNKSSYGK